MKRVWRVVSLLSLVALLCTARSSDLGYEPNVALLMLKGTLCLGLFAFSAWKGGLFE